MNKSYSELMMLETFEERFQYLQLKGTVGQATFGHSRYLNQALYRLPDWKSIRRTVIIRDNGCDLASPDHEIRLEPAYVHHINPISIDDILEHNPKVLDPENLITTTFLTHQAIHYGDENLLPKPPIERSPNDTCPWKVVK